MRYLRLSALFCLTLRAAGDAPVAHRISREMMTRYQLVLSQMQILQHEACEDAGIKFSSCRPQWDQGIVVEIKSAQQEGGKK